MHTLDKKGDTETPLTFDQTTEGRKLRQKQFLEALLEFGTIHAGCRAAGVSRACYYGWIENHPEFKVAVEHCFEDVGDDLEEQAFKRAKDKSDLLLIFTLKKFKPQYRDNYREPVGKPEEEEARGVAREEIEKKLDVLEQRQNEKLAEGVKKLKPGPKIVRSDETLDDDVEELEA